MVEAHDSAVSRFYDNRSIFITGATGFIGKVLLEKLLRSCPGIKNIYVLIREKKGKSPKKRWEEVMNSSVFDLLKSEHPESVNKVVVVTGDVTVPSLGISESEITAIIENVSLVFHSAATVKFEGPLKEAIDMNIVGTNRILELCLELQKIEALIHVSTAYSNCNRNEIEEVIYPTHMSPQQIIAMSRWMESKLMDTITPHIIGNRPNTYTFTKALAENLLAEQCGNLPVVIIRPSIVSAAWKEPFPGWIDSLNGSAGVILATATGMLRSFIGYGELVGDIIPVDVTVNLMIAAAWHITVHRPKRIMVYHCTSGRVNKTTWSEVLHTSLQYSLKYPSSELFRYPRMEFRRTQLSNNIHVVFAHYLIAFLYDAWIYIFQGKPRFVKLFQKIHKATDCLHYFTTHEWNFRCDNLLKLSGLLSEGDKEKFFFDVRSLKWDSFWEKHALGLRKFLLKEDPSTIPAARKKLKMHKLSWLLFQVLQVVLAVGMLVFIFSRVLSLDKL